MKQLFIIGMIFSLILCPMYLFTNLNFSVATCAFLLLCLGIFYKNKRSIHIPLMLGGITLDLGLVLFLQITRSAIQVAASGEENTLQMIHITCSTIAVVLYFPTIYFGFKTLKDYSFKPKHVKIAKLAFFFRLLGFIFMFSQLNKGK